jgi:hypothetical protein
MVKANRLFKRDRNPFYVYCIEELYLKAPFNDSLQPLFKDLKPFTFVYRVKAQPRRKPTRGKSTHEEQLLAVALHAQEQLQVSS